MIEIVPFDFVPGDALWSILEPIIRAGEAFALPRNMDRDAALAYWCAAGNEVFVAEEDGEILGTAFLRDNPLCPNQGLANAGYATAQSSEGRGVARALCDFTLKRATELGFKSMQFNYVVSSNERAVRLWKSLGFEVKEVLKDEFKHPALGPVDVYVMARSLSE